MKRFATGMLATLLGVIVTFSTVGAGELAKEGSGKYRSGRTAKVNVLKMGEEHMQRLAGWISDRFGRIRVMTFGGVAVGVLSPILVWIIGQGNARAALGAQLTMGVTLSL